MGIIQKDMLKSLAKSNNSSIGSRSNSGSKERKKPASQSQFSGGIYKHEEKKKKSQQQMNANPTGSQLILKKVIVDEKGKIKMRPTKSNLTAVQSLAKLNSSTQSFHDNSAFVKENQTIQNQSDMKHIFYDEQQDPIRSTLTSVPSMAFIPDSNSKNPQSVIFSKSRNKPPRVQKTSQLHLQGSVNNSNLNYSPSNDQFKTHQQINSGNPIIITKNQINKGKKGSHRKIPTAMTSVNSSASIGQRSLLQDNIKNLAKKLHGSNSNTNSTQKLKNFSLANLSNSTDQEQSLMIDSLKKRQASTGSLQPQQMSQLNPASQPNINFIIKTKTPHLQQKPIQNNFNLSFNNSFNNLARVNAPGQPNLQVQGNPHSTPKKLSPNSFHQSLNLSASKSQSSSVEPKQTVPTISKFQVKEDIYKKQYDLIMKRSRQISEVASKKEQNKSSLYQKIINIICNTIKPFSAILTEIFSYHAAKTLRAENLLKTERLQYKSKLEELESEVARLNRLINVQKQENSECITNIHKISHETKKIVKENNEYRSLVSEMKDELDYCKQRENKLMYFLFVMKERGINVGEVFEAEIKDIPTHRFSKYFDEKYKQIYKRQHGIKQIKRNKSWHSDRLYPKNFDALIDDSYLIPLILEAPIRKERPANVPQLDFGKLPKQKYVGSQETSFNDDALTHETKNSIQRIAKVKDKYALPTHPYRPKPEQFEEAKKLQLETITTRFRKTAGASSLNSDISLICSFNFDEINIRDEGGDESRDSFAYFEALRKQTMRGGLAGGKSPFDTSVSRVPTSTNPNLK